MLQFNNENYFLQKGSKMKIRVISSQDDIQYLDRDDRIIHLVFRPSNKDVLKVLQLCPKMEALRIASSYSKTLSDATKIFLDMQGVTLLEGDIRDDQKDIHVYSEINSRVFEKIKKLKLEGLSESKILEKMKNETSLKKDLLEFLVKERIPKKEKPRK